VLGRVATAEDCAEAIGWYVLGATFVTGDVMIVDGGASP